MDKLDLQAKIFAHLKAHQIDFDYLEHSPTATCEESAQARALPQRFGGKTLLFKDKHSFKLFTLSSIKEADSKKIRQITQSQKLRFATSEELWNLAGAKKGALPPFGRPILDFDHYIDDSIYENEIIAFNPGILTASIIMKVEDYLKLVPHSERSHFSR